ncbi:MAG: Glutamyl-tRNA(Gln) amidotransferase subunit E [Methanosaeta sp. PtaB.Bin039]|nr:MAG: Glutamyl-tRNA(Gln) amidotransferase subunit E [Methanosaeta sp. PtaB.Bin039]HOT07967.1 Glu-tRNA(Gln) amidotransferase subunit GatE [Methanotrichaceae archaeon]HQF17721.1 Glu-tRNA(Gln) amidotransferase subunit GatE [Methanotrichaceae archaeon]HQI92336.1 Glu-tRNA(Gln) amidotransferase subunit GatE [Methanotrichaceae archaeon]HQJ29421.1 Glu-tRNA(Gln) amidotransferase subunit GatE [Methanotrichaceae archaeon]
MTIPLEGLDYRALGLKCGIEIHQQLDSRSKLFCGCPTVLRDASESDLEFFRYLRPARSELGEIDRAALEETLVVRRFIYKSYSTTCLVEADEEPPQELNREALDITLTIATLLHMSVVDQVHTMRKTVIDGSNTSGFQRTAFVASHGSMDTSQGPVGIGILCLEEEAARIIDDRGDELVFSLDRLGIPLVEIGTDPDIVSPEHAREVAQHIGMILRSTGRVKRGLGTIRQDVNVSIRGGARVEIKGVQELGLIDRMVELEVLRQVRLLEIRDELVRRSASADFPVIDVTDHLRSSSSRVVLGAIKKGGSVLAARLQGFAGLVGREVQPGRRLGTEMSDRAKRAGVGGLFHTDELPAYGITAEEVSSLRSLVGAEEGDAVILVAAPLQRAEKAMHAALRRAMEAISGVPEETRRALPEGTSEYMRPLPGSARMYPETDVPPVVVTGEMLAGLKLPELFTERASRFERQYGLNQELAKLMASSPNFQLFEDIVSEFKSAPSVVVRTLETTPVELAREGVATSLLQERHFRECFALLARGAVAKEGLPSLLRAFAEDPEIEALEAAEKAGLGGLGSSEVEAIIREIVRSRADLVRDRKERSVGPLMGAAMQMLRGRADGALVSELLRREIERLLQS